MSLIKEGPFAHFDCGSDCVSVDELPPCRICGQADCAGSHPAAAIVRELVEALEHAQKVATEVSESGGGAEGYLMICDLAEELTPVLTAARAWLAEQEAT